MRKFPSSRLRKRPAERGQALVEFLVVAMFFLLPLFLATVALGKLVDVRHSAVMASRYAAWETTVWFQDAGTQFDAINGSNQKNAAQIRNEIAVRVINDRSAGVRIKATDGNATGFANGIDPMWRDIAGRPYLDSYDQATTTVAWQTPSRNVPAQAMGALAALPLPSGVTGTLLPPVPDKTLAVAQSAFSRVAYASDAYQRLWLHQEAGGEKWNGFDFSMPGAILSNTWSANGSLATHAMVAESVPTAKGFGTILNSTFNIAKTAWEPGAPSVEFGKIAVDVVPPDRLKK